MAKYVCVRKCFYNNRLFEEGEIFVTKDKVPRHFNLVEADKEEAKSETADETPSAEDGLEKLRMELEGYKKPFDRRWGITRLQHEIQLAKGGK